MLKSKNGKTFPKKPLDEYTFDDIKYIISQCNNITNILFHFYIYKNNIIDNLNLNQMYILFYYKKKPLINKLKIELK